MENECHRLAVAVALQSIANRPFSEKTLLEVRDLGEHTIVRIAIKPSDEELQQLLADAEPANREDIRWFFSEPIIVAITVVLGEVVCKEFENIQLS
jgi:hypothetical protein